VGGTSFGTFDPGSNPHPAYPTGFETVWNVLNQCSASNEGACISLGASGGGVSSFWGAPSYQSGPGVISSFSQKFPFCGLASAGQFCRETPDVSANADEFTPYAEYCTGNPATNSACATFSAGLTPPGWFGIGGTSLSSPLWSGILALWDSLHGKRFGSANFGLYKLFKGSQAYAKYFHDITGINQTENNNGYYPVTPDYDMGTGIGTPRISAIVESTP
jgi:kumamolisin